MDSKILIKGTGIVALLTFASRILGFFRDVVFAHIFGAGGRADAFLVAFRIPNLLRSLMAEGAMTSAFVPTFAGELREGEAAAQAAFRATAGLLIVFTSLLTVFGMVFSAELISIFAPGFNNGVLTEHGESRFQLAGDLLRIMMPYIMFVSYVAICNGALQTFKIFGAAANAQIVMNAVLLVFCIAALVVPTEQQVYLLAYGVIAGGLAQVVLLQNYMRKVKLSLLPSFTLFTPVIRKLMSLFLPAVLGTAGYNLTMFLTTVLASLLAVGSISWIYYAERLSQLPIGIFTVALSSVLLPALALASADKDKSGFSKNLADSLRYTSFAILPVAAGLFCYAEPIVALVYQRGEFNPYYTHMTATALKALVIGIWATSCASLLARAVIALHDTISPALITLIALTSNFVLALLLIGPLAQTATENGAFVQFIVTAQLFLLEWLPSTSLEHIGLCLAGSLSTFVSMAGLIAVLHVKKTEIYWRPFVVGTSKSLVAIMAASFVALSFWDGKTAPLSDSIPLAFSQLMMLSLGAIIFGLSYCFCLYLLKSKEIQETFRAFGRIVSRKNGGRKTVV